MAGPRAYSNATRSALAMLSKERCYFPDCPASILRFIDGEPYIDYQIAHIRDANPGNRFVETMTDDERRAFKNLILLCKPHHELVDKRHPERYSIEDLENWKVVCESVAIGPPGETARLTEEAMTEITEDTLADLLLIESVVEAQSLVTRTLQEQESAALSRVMAVLNDTSFSRVSEALDTMAEVSLLSPLGVRVDVPSTDFYLRIQREPTRLVINLDTHYESSVFIQYWQDGQSFSEVVLLLAEQVRPTTYWPGAERWEFASSINAIVSMLVCALKFKARGGQIANSIQLVGQTWLLSDWECYNIQHYYQITYSRIDETDWYSHLIGKSWTDRDEVAEMLEQGKFLRDLAKTMEII